LLDDVDLSFERLSVTPAVVQPGQKTIVRAGLRALGGNIDGQVVRFYAIPPGAGDLTLEEALTQFGSFDEEILTRIRAERIHEAQVPFYPTDLGTYQILVSALRRGEETLVGMASVDVVENPPATPTIPLPAATPTTSAIGPDDDACAISTTRGPSSKGALMLLLFPLLLVVLRSRYGRTEPCRSSWSGRG